MHRSAALQVLNSTDILGECSPTDMLVSPDVNASWGRVAVACPDQFEVLRIDYSISAFTASTAASVSDETPGVQTGSDIVVVETPLVLAFNSTALLMRWLPLPGSAGTSALLIISNSTGGDGLQLSLDLTPPDRSDVVRRLRHRALGCTVVAIVWWLLIPLQSSV
jgi:hypothetical protein